MNDSCGGDSCHLDRLPELLDRCDQALAPGWGDHLPDLRLDIELERELRVRDTHHELERSGLPAHTPRVDGLRRSLFSIRGYNTMDCPVVNVTGVEPGGSSASFFIAPVPLNCQFATPTVFSPDHDFGATWGGGSPIEIFVRAA